MIPDIQFLEINEYFARRGEKGGKTLITGLILLIHVDRSKLGAGSEGKSDEQSGLYKGIQDIHRLKTGEVALLTKEKLGKGMKMQDLYTDHQP